MENNRETEKKQYAKPRRKALGFLRGRQTRNFLIWFSVGLAFFLGVGLTLPVVAQAASLYFYPSSGSYSIGQTLTDSVYVSSSDQAINAASGIISFPQNKIQVVSLSKTGSIMSLWVQEPSFSNTIGTINFEGIILNPGFIGNNGKIIDIIFKSKASGITPLSFFSASVLANDGKGTNILTSSGSAKYNIIITTTTATSPSIPTGDARTPSAVIISSETHSDSNKWYSSATAELSWPLTDDITATRLLISRSSKAYPTVIYTPAISSKTITNLGEGIWYFYVQLRNKYGWGDVAHFRLQIDNTPPGPLEVEIDNEGDPTNPQPLLCFKTSDFLSGIDFYEIKIGEIYNLQISINEIKDNIYRLPLCPPGEYSLIVKAVDKVGKYSSVTKKLNIASIDVPIISDYSRILSKNDYLVILGYARLNDIVKLFIKSENKKVASYIAKRDNEKWSYKAEKPLQAGIYAIWAQAVDSRGAKSNFSEKVEISVDSPAFLRFGFGNFIVSYIDIIIIFIILIVLTALAWVYYARIKLVQTNLLKEDITQTQKNLYEAFDLLRREVTREIAKLDNNDLLSEREEAVNEELKKAIRKSEELITEEIKDIKEKIDKS